jgi:FixJ family two-component response regulator
MSESVSQIYIVDDDLSVRESVGRLIKSAGLNVRTFATAQEILGNLGQEMPSCLLLDIQLPGLDGFEAFQCPLALVSALHSRVLSLTIRRNVWPVEGYLLCVP